MNNTGIPNRAVYALTLLLTLFTLSGALAQTGYGTYRLYTSGGEYLQDVADGAQVDVSLTGTSLGLVAVPPVSVGSVRFIAPGGIDRTEGVAPYSILGDSGGANPTFTGWYPGLGATTVEVRYYSGSGGSGTLLGTEVLHLEFIRPPSPNYGAYALVDAGDGHIIRSLQGGESIDLAQVGHDITVKAVPPGDVGSVGFSTGTDRSRTENSAPFSIGGDTYSLPVGYFPWYPGTGPVTVTVNYYSGTFGSGSVLGGDELSLTFTDSSGPHPGCSGGVAQFPQGEDLDSAPLVWAQSGEDDFDLAFTGGTTPTAGTGPAAPFGGSGYAYAEADGHGNETTMMDSPCYDLSNSSGAALSFSYHMHGYSLGVLYLLASDDGGANWREVWYKSGDQGLDWNQASVDLSGYDGGSLRLRLAARIDVNMGGDIAVDELVFDAPGSGGGYRPAALSDANYVFARTYRNGMGSPGDIDSSSDVVEQVTYFDGLGRPEQKVDLQASGSKWDIYTPITYDGFGRKDKDWLSLPGNEYHDRGSYWSSAETETKIYYKFHEVYGDEFDLPSFFDANPYSQREYDGSPLNKIEKTAAPGYDWRLGGDHEVDIVYDSNIEGEVRNYEVSFTNGNTSLPLLVEGGSTYYPEQELYKTVTKDENWAPGQAHPKDHTAEEFTDKQGRVVLKRTYDMGAPHDTYYVYDDYGNLTYVLPPKVDTSDGVSALELEDLCYQYRYDGRNRLIEKKVPGRGDQQNWEEIVYDKLDRPVMTRDPNLKAAGKWLFTKYDVHGRVAYTGFSSSTATRVYLQDVLDRESTTVNWVDRKTSDAPLAGSSIYYDNIAKPIHVAGVYTINYYDTYLPPQGQAGITVPTETVYGEHITARTQGLPTVGRVRVLGTDDWITTVTGYDKKGRAIWTRSINTYLETDDVTQSLLGFDGRVIETTSVHKKGGQGDITLVDGYTYDHMGRQLGHTQSINGAAPELIAENVYDELGQLTAKNVGNTAAAPLQRVDYTYNVRGWLRKINDPGALGDDLFAFGISYNHPQMGASTTGPLYNGNISETRWRTVNDVPGGQTRGYAYSYDALNRIKNADYGIRTTGAFDLSTGYDMGVGAYDGNGNITSLTRQGAGGTVIDQLSYTYWDDGVSNRLRAVGDGAGSAGFRDGYTGVDDYYHDANGNMTRIANKGIMTGGITYNHLDLPTEVKITQDRGDGTGTIHYIYGADGTKLEKTSPNNVTQYAGNYIYEDGMLNFFNTEEGYVEPINGEDITLGFGYVYNYTDIWGNVRLSYGDRDGDGQIEVTNDPYTTEILKERNYYPFGLLHEGYNSDQYGITNNYRQYQGQEYTEDLGLNTHEWKYRMSDPAIGRFWQVDPLAEDYVYNSTYAFQENKMGMGVELEGLEIGPMPELTEQRNNSGGGFFTFVSELLGIGKIKDDIHSMGQRSNSELSRRSGDRLISSGINASETINENTSITIEGNARFSFGPQFALGVEGVGDVEMGTVSQQLLSVDSKIEFKLLDGVKANFNVNTDNTIINRAGISALGGLRTELISTKNENGNYSRQYSSEGNLLLLSTKATSNNRSDKVSVGLGTGIRAGALIIGEAEGGIFLNVENKKQN